MGSFDEAWQVICDYFQNEKKITEVAYKTWISRIIPKNIDFEKGEITLLVPNDFHRQTLKRCYMPMLEDAYTAVFGTTFETIFVIEDEITKKVEENFLSDEKSADAGYEFTFDTFIIGQSNKFAHAACLAVAQNPASAYNPLFLYGNSGLGKTHLLYAIGNDIKNSYPDKKIIYIKGDDFTNELIESIKLATMSDFRAKYRQADVLLVDDVQFIGGKERTQEEFFHTFNSLFEAKKQIVLTSDRPPKEIKILDDRLKTRFESGLLADIQPPDLETRIAIIKRKSEILGLNLSDDVCECIAQKLKSNIRQLEGIVKKLKARFYLTGETPTIAIVSEAISDILNNEAPPELTVEKIVEEVARTFGVEIDDIRSQKSRKANIKKPRQIAIFIVRELTSLSMEGIGKEFGDRHYSTIVYTVQKVEEDMKKDSKLKETIEDIIKNIRNR